MMKYLILMLFPCLAFSSITKDAVFYRMHPVELQKVLEQCPGTHPQDASCEQLEEYARHASGLVSELQYNPQLFGQKILALQEKLATLETELKTNPHNADLGTSIGEGKMQLRERLAIVKWLESPRG